MKRSKGIDVSHHQGAINWAQVESQLDLEFAIIRVAHGVSLDNQFFRNWKLARDTGLLVGVYHYFEHDHPATEQADFFLTHARCWSPGILPPVLDVECEHQDASEILAWLVRVESSTRLCPWIYTSSGDWKLGNDPRFDRYPLWVADITHTDKPWMPAAWTDCIMHQYSHTGRINGIKANVDLDVFNGDTGMLAAMARLI